MAAPRAAAALLLLPAAATAASPAAAPSPPPPRAHPQYVVLNKANFVADAWAWDQDRPATASQASVDALLAAVNCTAGAGGGCDRAGARRRLAVSHVLLLTGTNATAALEFLDATLALAAANDLPIAVELDVFQW
jgi:hypothetical protein